VKPTPVGVSFLVIGENIHATRTLTVKGRHVVRDASGVASVAFTPAGGSPLAMPLAAPIAAGSDFAAGRVKHVRNALLLGLADAGLAPVLIAGEPSAEAAVLATAYLVHLAARQQATGADWLDVNVDEVAGEVPIRIAAMEWLVRVLETDPTITIPLALDSSSTEVLAAGLRASRAPHGALLLNSASLERLDVLDVAVERGCPAVVGAGGATSMPSDTVGRVANADRILAAAFERGMAPDAIHLDPLVMPAAVDPDNGTAFLAAARQLRAAHPGIHITGGLSNVSFGLPGRRLLNDVFIRLCIENGVDSGIVDPIAASFDRIYGFAPDDAPYRLAANLLEGRDAYGMEYLAAFRAGALADALA
jgi:5-methyltetrahydrofolate--homocysteine methyltransferase